MFMATPPWKLVCVIVTPLTFPRPKLSGIGGGKVVGRSDIIPENYRITWACKTTSEEIYGFIFIDYPRIGVQRANEKNQMKPIK
jgi:hypothetical protein